MCLLSQSFVIFARVSALGSVDCLLVFTRVDEQINILLTEAALGMRFQMFGQYVIEGMYEEEKIMRAGSSEIMVIPEPARLDIKSPQANVREAIDLVKAILDLTAQNNHLWITFAEDGKSDRPSSGIALKIKDLERFEDYQDDVELWEEYEREMYDIERTIAGVNGLRLPDEMGIKFNEPEYPMSAQDQIALDTFMLTNNLITQKDLMLKYNLLHFIDEQVCFLIDEIETGDTTLISS